MSKSHLLALWIFLLGPLSHAEHVLYVGDSHSYISKLKVPALEKSFGHLWTESLRAAGHELDYYAACGSRPSSWKDGGSTSCGYATFVDGNFRSATRSLFPPVLRIRDPQRQTQVVVNLGDNMFRWDFMDGKRQASFSVSAFRSEMALFFADLQVDEERCTWIGPTYHAEGTNYRKPDGVVDEFYAEAGEWLRGRCRLIDSRPLVRPGKTSDGLHHGPGDSRLWAEGVLKQLGW